MPITNNNNNGLLKKPNETFNWEHSNAFLFIHSAITIQSNDQSYFPPEDTTDQ